MNELKKQILPILMKYQVQKAAIFGSYARGEQTDDSDVDILIELPKGMGLEFIDLKNELEKNLKKDVDLVTYGGLSPYMKDQILSEQQIIL